MSFLTYLWQRELKAHLIALVITSVLIGGVVLLMELFPDAMRVASLMCIGLFAVAALVSPIFMFRDWLRNQRERYETYQMELRWREQQQALKDGDE